jgi:hypothetical protein
MPNSGLEEFKEVVSDFRNLGAFAINSTVIAPLATPLFPLYPSWPAGISILTTLSELLVLICIFHFWFYLNRKRLNRRMLAALVLLCISLVVYLALYDLFTFKRPANKERDVKGFVLRSDVAPLIGDQFTAEDALMEAEYKPKEVWAAWSITTMRILLLAFWLLFFVSLSTFVGLFVMYQRRRTIKGLKHAI